MSNLKEINDQWVALAIGFIFTAILAFAGFTLPARGDYILKTPDKLQNIVLYEFSAEWCGNCKDFEPVMDEVRTKLPALGIKFIKIDTDETKELVKKFGIKGIPALVITVGGKLVTKVEGKFSDSEEVLRWIKEALAI